MAYWQDLYSVDRGLRNGHFDSPKIWFSAIENYEPYKG